MDVESIRKLKEQMDENNSFFSSGTKSLADTLKSGAMDKITKLSPIAKESLQKQSEIKKEIVRYGLQLLENLELPHLSNRRNLTDDQLRRLFHLLIEDGFISKDTDEECFIWILGGRTKPLSIIATYFWEFSDNMEADSEYILEEGGFGKIKWIKYVNKTRGYNTNKKALLDLLNLLDVPFAEWFNIPLMATLFIDKDDLPLKFNSQNYSDFKKDYKSEYHDTLKMIVDKSCL